MDSAQTISLLATIGVNLDRLKSAFQAMPPMPQPGMDPAMMGAPPQGGPPPGMDPAMMGAPPQGGPPQGGPPLGMDPAAGGAPPELMEMLSQIVGKMEEMDQRIAQLEGALQQIMGGLQQGNDPAPPQQ